MVMHALNRMLQQFNQKDFELQSKELSLEYHKDLSLDPNFLTSS